jgi:hypothetical protein
MLCPQWLCIPLVKFSMPEPMASYQLNPSQLRATHIPTVDLCVCICTPYHCYVMDKKNIVANEGLLYLFICYMRNRMHSPTINISNCLNCRSLCGPCPYQKEIYDYLFPETLVEMIQHTVLWIPVNNNAVNIVTSLFAVHNILYIHAVAF